MKFVSVLRSGLSGKTRKRRKIGLSQQPPYWRRPNRYKSSYKSI